MDTDTRIIEFTDMYDKFLGRATIKDNKVTGSTDLVTGLINTYEGDGTAFIDRFGNWANGYIKSELVPN